MCNYADDVKTVTNGSLDRPTADTAGATASINPATSGVTAGSGPDMWEPMTIGIMPSILELQAARVVFDMAKIGHKAIGITDAFAGNTIGLIVKTSDLAEAQALTGGEFLPIYALDPADYRGGGQHRRPTYDVKDNGGKGGRIGYLVERGEEFARKQDTWFATVPADGDIKQAKFFAILSDAETRNG